MKELIYKELEVEFTILDVKFYRKSSSKDYALYKITHEINGKVEYLVTKRKYIDGKEHGKAEARRKKKRYEPDKWEDLIEVPYIDAPDAVYFKKYEDALKYFSELDLSDNFENVSVVEEIYTPQPITFTTPATLNEGDKIEIQANEKAVIVNGTDDKTKKKIRELEKRIAVLEERYGKFHKVEFMLNHEYEIKKLPKRAPDYVPDDVEFTYGVNNK